MKTYRGSPAAARNYVEADRGRADDYYLAEGTGLAERYVASAEQGVRRATSLSGAAYEAWVAGVDPETGVPKGRLRHDGQAVRFVEVTVNGPKSWSLAAELHADISAAYDAAQDRAATQIVGWLAHHATTRIGPRGGQVQVPVADIEAVTVRHYTSRAGDPHRHLHLQINARVFAAGQWRGLHTVGIRDSLDAINGIGHAAVATDPQFRAALAAHGFTLGEGGEVVQLTSFTGAFSARAGQIARNLDRIEEDWRDANPGQEPGPPIRRSWDARAWAQDRPDKINPAPRESWNARWVHELHDLGYRDQHASAPLEATPIGSIDRDASAEVVLGRLAARRSGWNAADVRGEVEQLLVRAYVVADSTVRGELAEDLTARTLARCVPLLGRGGVPEHIRALTSPYVLEVECDVAGRLAARSAKPGKTTRIDTPTAFGVTDRRLDATQIAAAQALAGHAQLVVIEGAAGAGKTTTLAATRDLLEDAGHRLVVVTPTLKAAKVAQRELGAVASSAAGLVFQHGFRWDEHGRWTRLVHGQVDPLTGTVHLGPAGSAVLRAEDLLLVDEAGMLDQDTARALLILADEHHARVAFMGDRRQLSAIGRGGVLDLAVRHAPSEACLTLDTVHRFTRDTVSAHGAVVTVPDLEYADLTLAIRAGDDHGLVFDALLARSQIQIHETDADRLVALADIAAGDQLSGVQSAVVADTRDQVAELNAAIRDRLVVAGHVDDEHTTATATGQRVGVGDRVVTRRNDRNLDVANRDTWTISAIHPDGAATVTGENGPRDLPVGYLTDHVELAYACTLHGVQGDSAPTAHLVFGEHTGAASAYVGMTRGRAGNTAHLVTKSADTPDPIGDAREQWIAVFTRDRADLGPAHAAEQAAHEAANYAQPRPLGQALAELRDAWSVELDCLERLARDEPRAKQLRQIVAIRTEMDASLPGLKAEAQHSWQVAEAAAARRARTGAAVAHDASRLRDALLQGWDAQRPAAAQAAQSIAAGTGRFGARRRQIAAARDTLQQWAATWQPYLPDLPTDPAALARRAAWSDNRSAIWNAFEAWAAQRSAQLHPEHAVAEHAAQRAQMAERNAHTAYRDAARRYSARLAGHGGLGHTPDSHGQLAELETALVEVRDRLTHARRNINELARDPAIAAQRADRLTRERATWHSGRDTGRQAAVAARARANATDHARRDPAVEFATSRLLNRHQPQHGPSLGR